MTSLSSNQLSFLYTGPPFDMLVSLLESIGFTNNCTKVVYPAQWLTFLGVEIQRVVCLSCYLFARRQAWKVNVPNCTSSKCSKLHLQCPLGKLNCAACSVWGGHIFLTRLSSLANSVNRLYHCFVLELPFKTVNLPIVTGSSRLTWLLGKVSFPACFRRDYVVSS